MRISQTRRFEGDAVAIEIHLQLLNLAEEQDFSIDKLPNKPEIYMKVFVVARALQAAEKMSCFVILSEAKNLSSI
jgi:hypothetical protein